MIKKFLLTVFFPLSAFYFCVYGQEMNIQLSTPNVSFSETNSDNSSNPDFRLCIIDFIITAPMDASKCIISFTDPNGYPIENKTAAFINENSKYFLVLDNIRFPLIKINQSAGSSISALPKYTVQTSFLIDAQKASSWKELTLVVTDKNNASTSVKKQK